MPKKIIFYITEISFIAWNNMSSWKSNTPSPGNCKQYASNAFLKPYANGLSILLIGNIFFLLRRYGKPYLIRSGHYGIAQCGNGFFNGFHYLISGRKMPVVNWMKCRFIGFYLLQIIFSNLPD